MGLYSVQWFVSINYLINQVYNSINYPINQMYDSFIIVYRYIVFCNGTCNAEFILGNIETYIFILMGWWKKDVTPLLTHWSYVFLALSHQFYDISTHWEGVGSRNLFLWNTRAHL